MAMLWLRVVCGDDPDKTGIYQDGPVAGEFILDQIYHDESGLYMLRVGIPWYPRWHSFRTNLRAARRSRMRTAP